MCSTGLEQLTSLSAKASPVLQLQAPNLEDTENFVHSFQVLGVQCMTGIVTIARRKFPTCFQTMSRQ